MIEIILGIGVATFFVYTIFNVTYILSKRRTSESMASFFRNTEGNLNAALSELKETLENLKKITSDVGAVTGDVKKISNSIASVERRIQGVYDHMKEGLGSAAGANIAGLKAGIRTGVVTLVKSMHAERKE
jgi:peptidoglycan hydrolase CwlO-like protein